MHTIPDKYVLLSFVNQLLNNTVHFIYQIVAQISICSGCLWLVAAGRSNLSLPGPGYPPPTPIAHGAVAHSQSAFPSSIRDFPTCGFVYCISLLFLYITFVLDMYIAFFYSEIFISLFVYRFRRLYIMSKKIMVPLRLEESDKALIDDAAKRAGVKVSVWMRRALLDAVAPVSSMEVGADQVGLSPPFKDPVKKTRLALPKSNSVGLLACEIVDRNLCETLDSTAGNPTGFVSPQDVLDQVNASLGSEAVVLGKTPADPSAVVKPKKYTGACNVLNGRKMWEVEEANGSTRWTGDAPC